MIRTMKDLPCSLPHTLRAGGAALLAFTAAATAHPGHDEAPAPTHEPAFFLAQAGPMRRGPAAAPTAGKVENTVSITTEGDFRVIKSNGWPDHAPGAFPRRGNPNAATEQSYSFRVPLKPRMSETLERRGGWWWGVALNGVPFEPGTAETWNNDRQSGWRYEAATGFLNLGLDEHNAHVQPTGAYHYHALPVGLVERLGGDGKKMLQVGWAADGFPVYTSWACSEARNAKSALRKMKPSHRLRPGARPAQVDGPGGNYDGRFTEDFEYVKDSGDLDECNGRFGVTPEFPEGTYYYCITAEFPFVPRMWRGTPDPSFGKGGGPPGGGPGRGPGGGPGGGMGFPVIDALDLNGDAVIDAEELRRAPESLKSLDQNGDGKISSEEHRPPPPGGGFRPRAEGPRGR
jgi:hypothetical protein